MSTRWKEFIFVAILFFVGLNNGFSQDYYDDLSMDEVNQNYNNINTNGIITKINNVPNLKVSQNKNISDPHEMLPVFAEDIIQDIVDALHAKKDYEIMVVCLNSIGSKNPRIWGTALFNYWEIGDRDTKNGLLMLVINDVHRIEIITGRGMETVLTDAESNKIQQEHMIPFFKKNDYTTGIIRGIQAINNVLNRKTVLYDSNDSYTKKNQNHSHDSSSNYRKKSFQYNPNLVIYFGICGITTLIYFISLLFAYRKKDLYKRYQSMKFWKILMLAFIFPFPFMFLVFYTRKTLHRWRNMERLGYKSGELLHKLSEKEEDIHLSKGQITEEIVKSVDYDVWINEAGTDIVVLAYRSWFTPYNKCDNCKFKTYIKLYDKVLVSATYTRQGKGEKKYACKNCKHQKIINYKIPRKQRSEERKHYSGNSSGGFFGGGGSFGSSGSSSSGSSSSSRRSSKRNSKRSSSSGSSSSSRRSGGSFGGGSSGGGGSGSSW